MRKVFRRGVAAIALTGALALGACGYDPSTAGDQPPVDGEAPTVADPDTAITRASHLLADAEQLNRVVDDVLADDAVPGDVKSFAGELKGVLQQQLDRAGRYADGGSSMMTAEEVNGVIDASGDGAAAAFGEVARMQLPRLAFSWGQLTEAGEEDIAEVARDTAPQLEDLAQRAAELPGD